MTIVAVTKTVDRGAIDEAYALGLRHFGENRVQDARRKLAEPGPLPDGVTLHLIGQLQSNKAKPAVALFDIIESVDRISLVDVLEKEAERIRLVDGVPADGFRDRNDRHIFRLPA